MIGSDNFTRGNPAAFTGAGIGLQSARNCMPGNHHVMVQAGGRPMIWRGVRNVWHCAECVKAREAKGTTK